MAYEKVKEFTREANENCLSFVKIEFFKIIFKKNNSYYVQREGLSEEEVIEAVLEGVHSQTVVTAGILLVALR